MCWVCEDKLIYTFDEGSIHIFAIAGLMIQQTKVFCNQESMGVESFFSSEKIWR